MAILTFLVLGRIKEPWYAISEEAVMEQTHLQYKGGTSIHQPSGLPEPGTRGKYQPHTCVVKVAAVMDILLDLVT
jgi:hypothetical protein